MSSGLLRYHGALYRKADQNLLILMRGVSGSGDYSPGLKPGASTGVSPESM